MDTVEQKADRYVQTLEVKGTENAEREAFIAGHYSGVSQANMQWRDKLQSIVQLLKIAPQEALSLLETCAKS